MDFSTDKDPSVWVGYEGWPIDKRNEFYAASEHLTGVTAVKTGGNNVGVYIDFDPSITTEEALKTEIRTLVAAIMPTASEH